MGHVITWPTQYPQVNWPFLPLHLVLLYITCVKVIINCDWLNVIWSLMMTHAHFNVKVLQTESKFAAKKIICPDDTAGLPLLRKRAAIFYSSRGVCWASMCTCMLPQSACALPGRLSLTQLVRRGFDCAAAASLPTEMQQVLGSPLIPSSGVLTVKTSGRNKRPGGIWGSGCMALAGRDGLSHKRFWSAASENLTAPLLAKSTNWAREAGAER